jgi:transcriptional regulator with XRE-family HTH domain
VEADDQETPTRIFARNLRRLRHAAGLSQEELAARAGLHRTYVSSIERANRNVSIENIFALAAALKCDPRDLLAPLPPEEDA